MAAVVEIREKNGAGETPTTKTSSTIRFKNADDANVDLNDPIVRPGAGSVYSYEKALRLYIGATGPTGSITSPRAFSDGANGFGTGVTMEAGVTGTYVQPVSTNSAIGTVDLFSYTSGSPRTMDVTNAGPYTGTTLDIADYLYLQAEVANTASPGLTPSETLTIASKSGALAA
jgi:hypothetical protein